MPYIVSNWYAESKMYTLRLASVDDLLCQIYLKLVTKVASLEISAPGNMISLNMFVC